MALSILMINYRDDAGPLVLRDILIKSGPLGRKSLIVNCKLSIDN
jgi:hypothetical protein